LLLYGVQVMIGPLHEFLRRDHARLDELLHRASSGPEVDLESYETFRGGLLRHIAMEEKVLLPDARRRRGGEPLALAKQLRADHAVLAALLVPTPTREIIAAIGNVLAEHNPLEENAGGLYETCEQLAGVEADALLSRVRAVPEVPLARHFDGPRAHENIANLLRARTTIRST
jgi:hypothetical protein